MKDKSSNIETNNNILIILGMHRSGTSLTANWLNLCGLNLGDRMFGSNEFNPTGHFEDWDFLEFHNSVLNRNKAPFFVSENTPLQINDTDIKKAKELAINKNSKHKQWGWKDPRTCVFIDI